MKRFLFFLLVPWLLGLEVPTTGDTVLPLTLPNQHGKAVTVAVGTRIVLYVPDKKASELVRRFLQDKNRAYMEQTKLAVVSDLSAVPPFIRRLYIIPDLKNYPFDMLVIEDEFSPVIFESELEKVSVVFIDKGWQKKVKKAGTVEEIEKFITEEDHHGED